ncbi:cell division protein FtsZ [Formicincola oecophyllae]|uniref:Cell division protein FtsZ n=1 Tax=Formicincola oecophyllae TaxID=2558361 RepID=A0A4Y6U764_9PROT|nr:cell division protein FtsZ [Formicincola oecophyllae]QDH13014.1 cell division protein FtsZ [Formicincola oecophyllae]
MSIKLTPASPPADVANLPRIVVIGVGGGGGNAVDNMISTDLANVEFIAANTDAQQLSRALTDKRIQLGPQITRGLGAGARPETGRKAAEEVEDEIKGYFDQADLVFITAGMGGGTGTGAAPVIARIARESGALTVGVVSLPFNAEGRKRTRAAEAGIAELEKYVDTLIVVPNQNLFNCATQSTTLTDALKMSNDVLYRGVRGLTDLMVKPARINLDFSDVRSVLGDMGRAMIGTGVVTAEEGHEDRALVAAERAISNPLLEMDTVRGARSLLVNITGGTDLTLHEYEAILARITEEADADAEVISGLMEDPNLNGHIEVSVTATGLSPSRKAEGDSDEPFIIKPHLPSDEADLPQDMAERDGVNAPAQGDSAENEAQPAEQADGEGAHPTPKAEDVPPGRGVAEASVGQPSGHPLEHQRQVPAHDPHQQPGRAEWQGGATHQPSPSQPRVQPLNQGNPSNYGRSQAPAGNSPKKSGWFKRILGFGEEAPQNRQASQQPYPQQQGQGAQGSPYNHPSQQGHSEPARRSQAFQSSQGAYQPNNQPPQQDQGYGQHQPSPSSQQSLGPTPQPEAPNPSEEDLSIPTYLRRP